MEEWRLHTDNQLLILDDLKLSNMSVDKVTHFRLRPPELLQICDKLGDCYGTVGFINQKEKSRFQIFH